MPQSPIESIRDTLHSGGIVLLDGGIGTELQARDVPMHPQVWCASATLTHGHVLRRIHEDYIQAGADLITANTFSSNRIMLEPAGLGERTAEINTRAVAIAIEARERAAPDRPVAVAGSMSHQIPVVPGHDYRDGNQVPSAEVAAARFAEMAGLLADAGVDLILMEMMSDPDLATAAIEAALATGLPVWVGLSCRSVDDDLVSYARPECSFVDAVNTIVPAGGEVYGVMHSHTPVTGPALSVLRDHWSGPLMAYPDSGYFKMPEWQFEDIIPPEEFAPLVRKWIEQYGVQIVGGCCGLGVEHIRRLSDALTTFEPG